MDEQQPLTKKQRRELKRQAKLEQRAQTARRGTRSKLVIAIAVVVVVGGLIWLLGRGSDTTTTTAGQIPDPSKGPDTATVVVHEFSDFQCPACAAAQPTVKQMLEQYGEQIKFVYDDFPLTSIHPNAMNAALAGQCAFQQSNDSFWKLHDLLFERQSTWSTKAKSEALDDMKSYATELELDTATFNACVDGQATKDAVTDDQNEARAKDVSSTPTFFVNHERLVGASDLLSTVAKALGL